LLGLFGEIGKKERDTIVRREAILHRLMPPASAQSLVRGGDLLKLVPGGQLKLLLDCGRAATSN
jgi:hypothetical protein